MIDWYLTREETNVVHNGVEIPPGKKILLSPIQADLHGLQKTTAPDSVDECGVREEFTRATSVNFAPLGEPIVVDIPKTEEEEDVVE